MRAEWGTQSPAAAAAPDLPEVLYRARNARQLAERTLTAERSLALERARAARTHQELFEAEAEVVAEEQHADYTDARAMARLEVSGSARRDPLELPPSASLPRLDSLDRRLRALRSEHRSAEEKLEQLRSEHLSAEERLEQLRDQLDAPAHCAGRPTTLSR